MKSILKGMSFMKQELKVIMTKWAPMAKWEMGKIKRFIWKLKCNSKISIHNGIHGEENWYTEKLKEQLNQSPGWGGEKRQNNDRKDDTWNTRERSSDSIICEPEKETRVTWSEKKNNHSYNLNMKKKRTKHILVVVVGKQWRLTIFRQKLAKL